MDILDTIREQYPSFNKTQKRIADYLLQHPDVSCFSSLRQLAQNTGTTEATIMNFSRKLGCKSFLDLKGELQNYITLWMSPREKIKTATYQDESGDSAGREIQDAEQAAIRQTLDHSSPADLTEALHLLESARRVYVLSYDFTNTAAELFAARFIRLGIDVVSLGSLPMTDIIYRLAYCTPEDLIVLFSYSPYSLQPIELAKCMKEYGCKVLCFSDSFTNPIGQSASVILPSITNQTVFFNSITAPSALINHLAALYVTNNKENFNRIQERIEKLQASVGELPVK